MRRLCHFRGQADPPARPRARPELPSPPAPLLQGHKQRAVRYRSCALDEEVYLHPNSGLHSTAPEWVVYTDLVRTSKRPYMAGEGGHAPGGSTACASRQRGGPHQRRLCLGCWPMPTCPPAPLLQG